MMDYELESLLEAIKRGDICDPDQVRQILHDGSQALKTVYNRYRAQDRLFQDAREAFVQGWGQDVASGKV